MDKRAKADVERARACIGVPFRPQGRDLKIGLDCIGLVISTYAIREVVPRNYRLSGHSVKTVIANLPRTFRRVARSRRRAGDMLLFRLNNRQVHLAVQTTEGFLHADLTLGKVVEVPGEPVWPLAAVFRPRRRKMGV